VTERPPVTISEREWESRLWWMVAASGGLHVLLIGLLVLIPHSFLHHPPPMHSYTVDLVAPDQVGGSNMIAGGKGRVQAPPLAAAPPEPKVEPPKPPPPKVEEPKPPEPKPEPPKVEPPQLPQPEVAKVEPKPPPPKVEEKPKENEVALATKEKKVEPPPAPTAAKAAPSPQAKPQPSPKLVAKAEPAKPQPKAPPQVDTKAAQQAEAARKRDEQIEAAVRHVEQQAGKRGGGTGEKAAEQPGGPISVGPGEGAGGTVKGVEYLLYYNQMINRIKQSWAWADRNRSLEAAVRFNITNTGEVLNVRISHPSGDASYDASVERAVKAANPLPAPPEGYRKEFSDVELTFAPEQLQQ
jgi:TonB family protein